MEFMEDVLQISEDYNAFEVERNESEIIFEKGMSCPIPGCNVNTTFMTQAKFVRHWEERHIEKIVKFECPVKKCTTLAKRKSDMKHHFKQKHKETNENIIEDLLKKCQRKVVMATNYVDPIFYSYQGKKASAAKPEPVQPQAVFIPVTTDTISSVSEPEPIIKSVIVPVVTQSLTPTSTSTLEQNTTIPMVTDIFPIHTITEDEVDFTVHLNEKARISVEEYKARDKPFVPELSCTAIQMQNQPDHSVRQIIPTSAIFQSLPTLPLFNTSKDSETQTSNMDIDEIYLPPIPNTIPELEEYLRFLCNTMDRVGRLRESAKSQLDKLKRTTPSLEAERVERRRLEAENRALKREIAELKWRKEVFGSSET